MLGNVAHGRHPLHGLLGVDGLTLGQFIDEIYAPLAKANRPRTAAGTLTVNKACVAGIDKDSTKTGEDRRIELCPRALQVLNRQLAMRARRELAGKINHDQLFFKETGEPIRNLQYPYVRWQRTLVRTRRIRYRKPYCARHSSVSWNLMIGKRPLWVAKQHGHSITTMLSVYAAWAEGAIESDIYAIKRAMASRPRTLERAITGQTREPEQLRTPQQPKTPTPGSGIDATSPEACGTGFGTSHRQRWPKCSKNMNFDCRRERDSRRFLC
jgi:hypothetical protein